MTLTLEYTCTEAEKKEAEALHLREHYGHGSKWRTRLVLFGLLLATLGLVWLRFMTEVEPEDRWWMLTLMAALFVAVLAVRPFIKRKKEESVRIEVSNTELVHITANGRTVLPWSTLGQCLESPTLFALPNRGKTLLWVVPKRAFPDEQAQDWFRTLANQPPSAAAAASGGLSMPGRFAAQGITLTIRLGYRDYVTRIFASWRTRGIALAIVVFTAGASVYEAINPPPDAVVPPGEVFLMMMATIVPMLAVVLLVVAFISWRSEKKHLKPEHAALTGEGIHFSGSDGSGLLAWTAYKYYLENRWAFFIWNPRGSAWLMLPKRQFASPLDIEQCRDLLRANLKPSRWFYL